MPQSATDAAVVETADEGATASLWLTEFALAPEAVAVAEGGTITVTMTRRPRTTCG